MKGKRNQEIDLLKGIGIISIVVGHTFYAYAPGEVRKFVYVYHLAIFFFCSGYLFKDSYLESLKIFLIKKIKSLYLPYLGFGFFFLFLDIFRGNITGKEVSFFATRVLCLSSLNAFTGAMWFVKWLLLTEILFWGTLKIIVKRLHRGKITVIFYSIVMMLIGMVWSKYGITFAGIDIALVALPIITFGYLYRLYEIVIVKFIKYNVLYCLFSAGVIVLLNYFTKEEVEFSIRHYYGNGILFLPIVFMGIFFCITLAKVIQKNVYTEKIVIICGKYSFWIMALHFLLFKIIDRIYFWKNSSTLDYQESTILPYAYSQLRIVYIVIGCLLPVLLGSAFRKVKINIKGMYKE